MRRTGCTPLSWGLLSRPTIARRVSDLDKHVSLKRKSIVEACLYFSLGLDESTDICDTSHFLIFIRTVGENFTVYEKLVKMCSLNEGTKCHRQNPFLRILIKTDPRPSKTARPPSTSTTYCCWRPTFTIRVFVLLAILRNDI